MNFKLNIIYALIKYNDILHAYYANAVDKKYIYLMISLSANKTDGRAYNIK